MVSEKPGRDAGTDVISMWGKCSINPVAGQVYRLNENYYHLMVVLK